MTTKIGALLLVMVLACASLNAEAARRLGGGKSVGQQSSNVTQREAAQMPGSPAPAVAAPAPASKPPMATPAPAAPKRPWGAMLGGLAAGLGLAWLASSLGLGEAFGQFMMIALLVMVVMMVIGMVMRGRKAVQGGSGMAHDGGLALQGAGGVPVDGVNVPRAYNPGNVGNDASARPWERSNSTFGTPESSRFGSESGGMIGSALRGSPAWGIPADFDVNGFLSAAKTNFVTLQNAWDRSDVPALRAMMTDAMLAEIKTQLAERETHRGMQPNTTDVMVLDAQLLGIEDLGEAYLASVEFSGMIREEPSAGPNAFREVWNMTKPKAGGGWLVAGVQALQ